MSYGAYSFGTNANTIKNGDVMSFIYPALGLDYELPVKVADFKPGDEVTVTLTGTVFENKDGLRAFDWDYVGDAKPDYRSARPLYLNSRKVTALSVNKKAPQPPEWQAGDVVTIRFNGPASRSYTYVRGYKDWPGETVKLTDTQVNDYYRRGNVAHLVRNGQKL